MKLRYDTCTLSLCSLRYLGRLDTWNACLEDVEDLRDEIMDFSVDLTLFEQFGSRSLPLPPQQRQEFNEGEHFALQV